MVVFLVLLAFIVIDSHILGSLVLSKSKAEQEWAKPVVGLALLLLFFSPLYFLRIPLEYTLPILLGVSILARKRVGTLAPQIIAIALIVVTYILQFGYKSYITGYFVSNDAVMHAIMARTDNVRIADKLEASPEDLSQYPRATHAIVNMLSKLSGIETSYLIVPMALFFSTYTSYPLFYLGMMLTKRKVLSTVLAGVGAASYYPLAIAYHGFLPQAAFVPFIISAAMIAKGRVLPLAILVAAAVGSYRFVSYLPLLVIVALQYWENKFDWRKTAFLFLLAIVLATTDSWVSWQQLLLVLRGKSVIAGAVQVNGNLSGFINPGILTGVWFESDYRFVNPDRLVKYLPYFSAIPILGLAGAGWKKLLDTHKWMALQLMGLMASVIIVAIITKSPYSTSKMMSLVAPIIPILAVGGLWKIWKNKLMIISSVVMYTGLVLISVHFLLRGMSVLPSEVFGQMRQLRDYIGHEETIIYSDNDWLSYYVDAPWIDITELHYLPDNIEHGKKYEYVVDEKCHDNCAVRNCETITELSTFDICFYQN